MEGLLLLVPHSFPQLLGPPETGDPRQPQGPGHCGIGISKREREYVAGRQHRSYLDKSPEEAPMYSTFNTHPDSTAIASCGQQCNKQSSNVTKENDEVVGEDRTLKPLVERVKTPEHHSRKLKSVKHTIGLLHIRLGFCNFSVVTK